MRVYTITIKNHFKVLLWHLVGTTLLIIGFAILFGFDKSSINFLIVCWSMLSAPVFYVHAEHFLVNRNSKLTLFENSLRFERGDQLINCNFDDINRIVFYKSNNLGPRKMQWFAHESYYYARFYLLSGESFLITNLMIPQVEKLFPLFKKANVERQYAFYPSLSLPITIPSSWIMDFNR